MFSRAEAAAAGVVAIPASAIVLAYLADAAGVGLHPLAIGIAALAIGAALARQLHARGERVGPRDRPSAGSERADSGGLESAAFIAIVAAVAAWLLWLAWPHLLPIGGGSDLTHHLLLIDYIDRTNRLVHDRALAPYLGEMLDYTPGAHVLAVIAGRWVRIDGLHAIYTIVALSVALKSGVVFLVARRCVQWMPIALAAPLLLFLPHDYFLGSFAHDSFLAQVVAELFAVTAWWAIVAWDQRPTTLAAFVAGLMSGATFLTWPVWVGPVVLTFLAVTALHRDRSALDRVRDLTVAIAPVVVVAAVHAAGRVGAAAIAGASGFAPIPTLAITGWLFPALGLTGTAIACADRRVRSVPLLLAAIALQAAALVMVARASAAEAPYLALKMFYLAIYPLAVAGAMAIEWPFRSAEASRSDTSMRSTPGERSVASAHGARGFSRALAAAPVAILAMVVAREIFTTPRPTPVINNALLDAGRWARTHVPPACVDYLVADDDGAYWLHVVVLGNPRAAKRSLSPDTYDPQKALVRWILPPGLPYAIVQDFDALPRDIREHVRVVARFGPAAVVNRGGDVACGAP